MGTPVPMDDHDDEGVGDDIVELLRYLANNRRGLEIDAPAFDVLCDAMSAAADRIERSGEIVRQQIADDVSATVGPLLDKSRYDGGYDCCGCSTYQEILDHCVAVILHGRGAALPED